MITAPRMPKRSYQYKVIFIGLPSIGSTDCTVTGVVLEWTENDAPPTPSQTVPSDAISKSPALSSHVRFPALEQWLPTTQIVLLDQSPLENIACWH